MKKFLSVLLALVLGAGALCLVAVSGPDPHALLAKLQALNEERSRPETAREESAFSEPELSLPDDEESLPDLPEESKPDEEASTPEESEPGIPIKLIVNNISEGNLYLAVRNEVGGHLDQSFTLLVTYPNGKEYEIPSDETGTASLTDLSGGDYSVSLIPTEGYRLISDVRVQVAGAKARTKIENISSKVRILITTLEISERELKGQKEDDSGQGEIDELTGGNFSLSHPEESLPEGNRLLSDGIFSYGVSPHNYLLLADGVTESNVRPVLDASGHLHHGERAVSASGGNEETGNEPVWETVELFDAEGNPLPTYKISLIVVPSSGLRGWQVIDGKTYYYDENLQKVTGYLKIDGKHYYFDNNGVKAQSLGIDVSEWQTITSWSSVKEAGIDFVIVRIGGRGYGSGSIYSDDRAISYLRAAKNAGLKIGVYFFSAAINADEAVEEASWTLEALDGMALDFPIIIDMEHSGDYPNGRADRLSRTQHTNVAKAFCEAIESGGYDAGVYASKSYFDGELQYNSIKNYYIWLANYTANYTMTTFTKHYDMWQLTPKARINGITGNVDLDIIF